MINQLQQLKHLITESEKVKTVLVQEPLPVEPAELSPVMSEQTIALHFEKLAHAYVTRYNKGEGDSEFNHAGAVLHNIFFAQVCKPKSTNLPHGAAKLFIDKHYATGFVDFKTEFEQAAMGIQGSGWVYLAKNGNIKTIVNHELRTDIILLIDWWEHAWILDYGVDKKKYLQNMWKIIDWSVINDRLTTMNEK